MVLKEMVKSAKSMVRAREMDIQRFKTKLKLSDHNNNGVVISDMIAGPELSLQPKYRIKSGRRIDNTGDQSQQSGRIKMDQYNSVDAGGTDFVQKKGMNLIRVNKSGNQNPGSGGGVVRPYITNTPKYRNSMNNQNETDSNSTTNSNYMMKKNFNSNNSHAHGIGKNNMIRNSYDNGPDDLRNSGSGKNVRNVNHFIESIENQKELRNVNLRDIADIRGMVDQKSEKNISENSNRKGSGMLNNNFIDNKRNSQERQNQMAGIDK